MHNNLRALEVVNRLLLKKSTFAQAMICATDITKETTDSLHSNLQKKRPCVLKTSLLMSPHIKLNLPHYNVNDSSYPTRLTNWFLLVRCDFRDQIAGKPAAAGGQVKSAVSVLTHQPAG
jgi:hypothetical protein